MNKTHLCGEEAESRINQWKEQYKQGIYAVEADGHIAYFKNPGRHEMNCAMSKASGDAALDMYEDLAQRTFIGGSEEMLKEDQKFYGLIQQIKIKMDGKKATLVNL